MMHADLIDQEDLRGQFKAIGFDTPSDATAEQACECVVRGLDEIRALALRKLVEDLYRSNATIMPAVRQAIDKQLLPALAQYARR